MDSFTIAKVRNKISNYGWKPGSIIITDDNVLKISLKNEYGNIKISENRIMTSNYMEKFMELLTEIDNCRSDDNNHLTIYFSGVSPYNIGVINNSEDITDKLFSISNDAVSKKRVELGQEVDKLNRSYYATTKDIFDSRQTGSLKELFTWKNGDGMGYETVDISYLYDYIKEFLEYGASERLISVFQKFYDELLSGVYERVDKFYLVGYAKAQCREMEILRKLMLAGISILEKYGDMIKQNPSDALEIRDKLIRTLDYEKIIECDYNYNLGYIWKSPYDEENSNSQVFKELVSEQAEKLSKDETYGLILYKACFYKEVNEIVRFLRSKNLDIDSDMEENDAKYIENILDSGYKRYIEGVNADKKEVGDGVFYDEYFEKYQPTMLSEFFRQYPHHTFQNKDDYKNAIYYCINQVKSALKKCQLSDDIVVYRGIAGDNGLLVNDRGFISTSLSLATADEFSKMLERRNNGIKAPRVYKIIIPKGSYVICYSNDLFKGDGSNRFDEPQQEVLFDADNFDLVFLDSTYRNNEAYFDIYRLEPKVLIEELGAKKGR